MKLQMIKNAVTSRAGRQILTLQKHSPRLLFIAGVVGFGATVVLAARATLKVGDVLDEIEDQKHELKNKPEYKAIDGVQTIVGTREVEPRELALVQVRGGFKIAGLYSPAVVVGSLSIVALTSAHLVLTRRNASLTAAYVALDRGFREYRKRVIDQFGEDQDRTFRYGMVDGEVYDNPDDSDKARPVKVLGERKSSIYARFFDEGNKNWDRNYMYNRQFLKCQEQYANDLLRARGHLLLNDVYDMLGMDRTKAGCIVGWVKGHADDYVSFGFFDDMYAGQLFVNGDERSILLDFNVDGVVYDLIENSR